MRTINSQIAVRDNYKIVSRQEEIRNNTKEYEEQLELSRKYANAIKEINIDKLRSNHDKVMLLKSLEHKGAECPRDCSKCGYKEYESGMCWYLMVHDKPASKDDKKCNHFVDAIEFIEKGRN